MTDTVRTLVETVTAQPGFTSATGTRVLYAEPGDVHLVLDRRDDLLQFAGNFHGGVLAGLADHAAGGAVTTTLPAGKFVITIDLTINFYAAADGDELIARAAATHVGITIAHATVSLTTRDGDGPERRCAHAVATFRVIDRSPVTE